MSALNAVAPPATLPPLAAAPTAAAAPREVKPNLEVEEFLRGPVAQAAPDLGAVEVEAPLVEQLPVSREGFDQVVPVDLEEVFKNGNALVLVEVGSRFAGPFQPEIGHCFFGKLLDLKEKYRGHVEINPDVGKL